MSGLDWISKWAHYSRQKTAIVETWSERKTSYAELNDLALGMAYAIREEFDIQKGDRIVVLSGFNTAFIALFSAAQKLGFVIVPLNTRLTKHEIKFQIKDCNAKLVICQEEFSHLVEEVTVQRVSWDRLRSETVNHIAADISENDPIFILYSSGTTGKPKGVIYTHKMLFWNSINTQLRLDINSKDITVNCMPSFHTGGWNVLITPFLHHGATVWLTNDFDPDDFLRQLEKSRSTLFMAVPTMLKLMSDTQSIDKVNLKSIRYIIVGGEALPIPTIEYWAKKGLPIRQGYGLTEVGPNVTSLHQDDTIRKRGSIGFFNFYINGKVVRDDGTECGPNEVGELWLSGPNVTPGYWHNDAANESSFEGRWFKTGDLVKRDKEGYIYVAGRKKEMYISGGENVYPREVEKTLQNHPDISEVAIVGVPDEKWGETGAGFVVLNTGSNLTEYKLTEYAKEYLAKFKVPRYIYFIDKLPVNDAGKINKRELLDLFTNTHKPNNHENV